MRPRLGQRGVSVTARRTRLDVAPALRDLGDVRSPAAARIVLVLDNLTPHSPAAPDEVVPPAEAKRLADKLALHHTPTHGSRPTTAELELSALQRQCPRPRLPDREALIREVGGWVRRRNEQTKRIALRFTTADARTKLRRLYPAFEA